MKEEVLLCYNNSALFCQEAQWAGRVVVAVLCSTRCIVALRRLELERGERGQTCGKTTGCHLSPCLNPGIPLYFIPGCCTLYKCGYNLSPLLPPGSCTSTQQYTFGWVLSEPWSLVYKLYTYTGYYTLYTNWVSLELLPFPGSDVQTILYTLGWRNLSPPDICAWSRGWRVCQLTLRCYFLKTPECEISAFTVGSDWHRHRDGGVTRTQMSNVSPQMSPGYVASKHTGLPHIDKNQCTRWCSYMLNMKDS